MWFSAAAAVTIIALISGIIIEPPLGGGTADAQARTAALLSSVLAVLLAMTAVGLIRHRSWARLPIMCISPLILIAAIGCGALGVIPATAALGVMLGAIFFGVGAAWLLFRHKPSVDYFAALDRR